MAVLMAAVPPHERPRERLLARGAGALTERELLALVLRNGTRGLSALDLAAELLAEYGGLSALAMARPEELASRKGVGAAATSAGPRRTAGSSPAESARPPSWNAATRAAALGGPAL